VIRKTNIELLRGEQIVFEADPVVLTNQRVLANWKGPDGGRPSVQAPIEELLEYEKLNGGQESRVQTGLQLIAAGIVLLAANLLLDKAVSGGLPSVIDSVLFVGEAIALIYGTYIVLTSFVSPAPRTTILFTNIEGKTFAISFPGWDNSQAQEFTIRFDRAKRDI
jgi:hypothetical protein